MDRCKDCAYCRARTIKDSKGKPTNCVMHKCHFCPPMVFMKGDGDYMSVWPDVEINDYCAYYKATPKRTREKQYSPQHIECFNMVVDEMNLSSRAANCLYDSGITYIGELVQKRRQDLFKHNNVGKKTINEIENKLKTMGLRLGMSISKWKPGKMEIL